MAILSDGRSALRFALSSAPRSLFGCAAVLCATSAVSCGGGGGDGSTGPTPVANVSVSILKSSLIIGESTTASAVTKDANGNVLSGRAINWSASDVRIASVDASGVVRALAAGSVNINATSEGQSGSVLVTVAPVPVASVSVSLASPTINKGATTQATATLKDANGNILTGRSIFWLSDNTGVATVTQGGLVTGVGAGTANISAASESQSGAATITVVVPQVASVAVSLTSPVLAPGSRTQASATPLDANGVPLTGKSISWSSDNPAVASVTLQGVVTAVSVGSANIIATSDGVPGSAALSVAVSAGYGTSAQKVNIVDIGTTLSPTLSGSSASSTTFVSRATSVATVDAQGVVTAVGEGQTWVAAISSGFAPDSIYVIVPRNAAAPILRSDLTGYAVQSGNTVSVNVLIDTRTMPIGGAELSVGYTTQPTVFASVSATAVGSPAPIVSRIQTGVYRVSFASGTAISGQQILVRFDFTAFAAAAPQVNQSGFLILTLLDIVDPTGADLLPVSTSTRYPIIVK